MKKLLIVLAAAATLAGCGKSENGAKTFTVGFDAEFPPYGFKQGDGYVGFDLDLASAVCSKLGWKFVARPIKWATKDMELNSGMIDCIWNGFTIQGREGKYTFSSPYIDNSQVVLVKKGAKIKSLKDLAGKIVGVQTDTPVQKALSAKGEKEALGKTFKQLVVVPNYNEAVKELTMGALDAVALDIGVAKKKMSDLPDQFTMLEEIVMTETYGIGFKLGNTALKDTVEAELRKLFADGTAAKLAAKYGIEPKALILK